MNDSLLSRLVAATFVGAVLLATVLTAAVAHASWFSDLKNLFTEERVQVMAGAAGSVKQTDVLTTGDVRSALKDALQLGVTHVIAQLGRPDGFYADKVARIALPEDIKIAEKLLSTVGLGSIAQNLETRLNRAAEAALPHAQELFVKAIQDMTIDDAVTVLNGPSNAATKYFQIKMTPELAARLSPLVAESLKDVGAVQAYKMLQGGLNQWANNPLIGGIVPKMETDLTTYTVNKALDATFAYLAVQEKEIRRNPSRWTTDVLSRVFTTQK